jgi:hypothetical protein
MGYYHPYMDMQCLSCHNQILSGMEHSVYSHDTQMAAAETANQQLLATPAFRTELKEFKKKITAARKAGAAYQKALTASKRTWREQIAQHIAEIKASRDATISSFQETDVYKTWRRLSSSLTLAEAKFAKKHNLSRWQTRLLFPHRSRYRRRLGGARLLKYAFWLRI